MNILKKNILKIKNNYYIYAYKYNNLLYIINEIYIKILYIRFKHVIDKIPITVHLLINEKKL